MSVILTLSEQSESKEKNPCILSLLLLVPLFSNLRDKTTVILAALTLQVPA
jgi:hypothetical protein